MGWEDINRIDTQLIGIRLPIPKKLNGGGNLQNRSKLTFICVP